MIILGDDKVKNSEIPIPWVTWTLIGMNLFAFIMQIVVGDSLTDGCAMTPKEITTGTDIIKPQFITVKHEDYDWDDRDARGKPQWTVRNERIEITHAPGPFPIYLTLFTSMFLHAGWAHLLGNMWFLAVFGDNVEKTLGHAWFMGIYFLCGLAAGLAHVISAPDSIIPALGASGAISGIMAAYVCMFPLNTVRLWMGWYIGVVEVPAVIVIGLWGILQYVGGILTLTSPTEGGGVAYWAHLGGFAAGLLIVGALIFLAQIVHQEKKTASAADPLAPVGGNATETPTPVPRYTFGWSTTLSTAAYLDRKFDDPDGS